MASLRVINWEDPLMEFQVWTLRYQNRESHLVHNLELRLAITRECKRGMLRAMLGALQGYLTRLQGYT